MQRYKKIFLILCTIIITMTFATENSYAFSLTEIIGSGDNFIKKAEDSDAFDSQPVFDSQREKRGIDAIYYTMLTIGIILAVIVGIILGIQFITSGAAGQAKVKEKLIPYIIGAFVVFGAFGIWRITYNVLNGVFH